MTKTMKITLTEDFLVPTDDGNIIFEPGDEIEVEYEDDMIEAPDEDLIEEPTPEVAPEVDPIADTTNPDPLSFAGNEAEPEEVAPEPDPEDTEVYIEDPVYHMV